MSAGLSSCAAVVTAAGSGTRLGAGIPKALVPLAGRPMLSYAVAGMALAGVTTIVVTAPGDSLGEFEAAVRPEELAAAAATAWPRTHIAWPRTTATEADVRVVAGGASRQASVSAGIAALAEVHPRVILVHDAARPLTPPELITRLAKSVTERTPAVIPGVPVADTLKRVDASGRVAETVDRSVVRAIQTPQAFTAELLSRAHAFGAARAHDETLAATDDAGLVEAMGESVLVIKGKCTAAKITTAADLRLAEAQLAALR